MTDTRLLELALKGLEAERARLDEEISQVKKQMQVPRPAIGVTAKGSAAEATMQPRRTMSAAARRRISEGMKRRHAELKRLATSRKK